MDQVPLLKRTKIIFAAIIPLAVISFIVVYLSILALSSPYQTITPYMLVGSWIALGFIPVLLLGIASEVWNDKRPARYSLMSGFMTSFLTVLIVDMLFQDTQDAGQFSVMFCTLIASAGLAIACFIKYARRKKHEEPSHIA